MFVVDCMVVVEGVCVVRCVYVGFCGVVGSGCVFLFVCV